MSAPAWSLDVLALTEAGHLGVCLAVLLVLPGLVFCATSPRCSRCSRFTKDSLPHAVLSKASLAISVSSGLLAVRAYLEVPLLGVEAGLWAGQWPRVFGSLAALIQAVLWLCLAWVAANILDAVDLWVYRVLEMPLAEHVVKSRAILCSLELQGQGSLENYTKGSVGTRRRLYETVLHPSFQILKTCIWLVGACYTLGLDVTGNLMGGGSLFLFMIPALIGGSHFFTCIWACAMMCFRASCSTANQGDIMALCTASGTPAFVGFLEFVGILETHIRGFDMKLNIIPNSELVGYVICNWSARPYKLIHETFTVSPRCDHASLRVFEAAVKKMVKTHPDVDHSKYSKMCISAFGPDGVEFVIICFHHKSVHKNTLRSDLLLRLHQMAQELKVQILCAQLRPGLVDAEKPWAQYDQPLPEIPSLGQVVPEPPEYSGKPRSVDGGFHHGPQSFELQLSEQLTRGHTQLWHLVSGESTKAVLPQLKFDFRCTLKGKVPHQEHEDDSTETAATEEAGKLDGLKGRMAKLSVLLCSADGLPGDRGDKLHVSVSVKQTQVGHDLTHALKTKDAYVIDGQCTWNEVLHLDEVPLLKGAVLELAFGRQKDMSKLVSHSLHDLSHISVPNSSEKSLHFDAVRQFDLCNLIASPDSFQLELNI